MWEISRDWTTLEHGASGEPGGPNETVVAVVRGGGTVKRPLAGSRLLRVLVVDDDPDTADSCSTLVKMWGHDARVAYGSAAALQMAAAYEPDVLLLDLAMPAMDGCEVLRQLRRQGSCRTSLLVAVTGYSDKAHRLLCLQAGFDVILVKPPDPSAVERLLRLEHARRRLADVAPVLRELANPANRIPCSV